MNLSANNLRAMMCAVLAITVATASSLNSYAASTEGTARSPIDESSSAQDQTGILSGKGQISINGNAAQAGATVLSGSTIATGADSEALIDLGPLGRIQLRAGTTVTLVFTPSMVEIKSQCSRTEIAVTRGQLDVASPSTGKITAGEKKTYDGGVDATAAGGADFIVDCSANPAPKGTFIGPGALGVVGLAGVAAAVAAGIILGRGEKPKPGPSPKTP